VPAPERVAAEPVQKQSGTTLAKVVSAGFENGNRADFFLDGFPVDIAGESGRRGLNVVVVDSRTEEVVLRKTYDIWGDPEEANSRLAADLNAVAEGSILLAALKDSGMEEIGDQGIAALKEFGARISGDFKMREGYALIGLKGGPALVEKRGWLVDAEASLPCKVKLPKPATVAGAAAYSAPPPTSPAGSPMPAGISGAARAAQAVPLPPMPAPPASAAAQQRASSFPTTPSYSTAPAPSPPPPAAAAATRPPSSSFPTSSSFARAPAPAPAAAPRPRTQPPAPEGKRVPKLKVDEQGGVGYDKAGEAGNGQDWQEVVLMLDQLQEKIKARRSAGEQPVGFPLR